MQRADFELTLTLLDQKLIIHGGDTRLEQEFPSAAALVEHALRVVKLRQAEGYRVTAERKNEQIVMPPEPEVKTEEKDGKDAKDAPDKPAKPAKGKKAAAAPAVVITEDDDDDDEDDDDEEDDDAAEPKVEPTV
jgi:hypothetical protein